MWWFGMPAILRGWFEQVFVQGYAYGLTDEAQAASMALTERVLSLTTTDPISFRPISDYDSDFVLRPELASSEGGLSIHRD